ncbi:MAG: acylphosphatase [Deltaproteobacteria bacterium]|nr:acylphosphatase [Deltaproteobacteria bacterium]
MSGKNEERGALIRRRAIVHGRVQGVAFRASTCEAARRAGVDGWVRNLADGGVEAVFEGDPSAVATLLAFCREGPAWAEVNDLEVFDEAPRGDSGFEIQHA